MSKGNLLIIDDEVSIVNNLSILLESSADNIYTAYNGLEALEQINDQDIHCIICDINMPKMNGVMVLQKIRENNLIDCPFIFFTAHGNEELMMEAAKLGAFDFLDKPNFDGLEEVVERALREGKGGSVRVSENDFQSEFDQLFKK